VIPFPLFLSRCGCRWSPCSIFDFGSLCSEGDRGGFSQGSLTVAGYRFESEDAKHRPRRSLAPDGQKQSHRRCRAGPTCSQTCRPKARVISKQHDQERRSNSRPQSKSLRCLLLAASRCVPVHQAESHIDCSEVVWSCVPRFMGDDERFACSTHFYSVDENQGRYLHHHSQKFNPRGNRDRLETRCANERVIDYMKR
jgi:hypothetical protein